MVDFWSAIATFLPSMLVLLTLSAFFSASEASMFSLSLSERRELHGGSTSERVAATLLGRSDRLLMGILFWNLTVNLTYFAIASRVAQQLGVSYSAGRGVISPELFDLISLLIVVLFAEFLPKCVAVLRPRSIVRVVALPLAVAIRLLDGVLPALKFVNEVSRRIILPEFRPEPYLETADLNRAVELSTDDSSLLEHERQVLRNIIELSDIRVEEWMRPRSQFRTAPINVSLDQIDAEMISGGYLLVSDKLGREIVAAVNLGSMKTGEGANLMSFREAVLILPWCTSIADALDRMHESQKQVALIVNEFGETIGVLTLEEIIEAVFKIGSPQSHREWARADIVMEGDGVWLVTGMTGLRRLERVVGQKISAGRNLTVAGAMQERLKRIAQAGDVCEVGDLSMEVIESGRMGELLVRVSIRKIKENAE